MTKNILPVESTHVHNDALWLALIAWDATFIIAVVNVALRSLI